MYSPLAGIGDGARFFVERFLYCDGDTFGDPAGRAQFTLGWSGLSPGRTSPAESRVQPYLLAMSAT